MEVSGTELLTIENKLTLRPIRVSFTGSISNRPLSSTASAASMTSKFQLLDKHPKYQCILMDCFTLKSDLNNIKLAHTLTAPSEPIVINSPSSTLNWWMVPAWQVRCPLRHISTFIRPPSQRSMFPHSDPDTTWREKKEICLKIKIQANCKSNLCKQTGSPAPKWMLLVEPNKLRLYFCLVLL